MMKRDVVSRAFLFALNKHAGQKDDCGKNYFESHILPVYGVLGEVTSDEVVLCAGLLHDTLEDTETTFEELRLTFGDDVAKLVLMVSHAGSKSRGYYFPDLKAGLLTNGWVASDSDLQRAMLVKFADRLSNLSRMEAWSKNRAKHYMNKSRFWELTPKQTPKI